MKIEILDSDSDGENGQKRRQAAEQVGTPTLQAMAASQLSTSHPTATTTTDTTGIQLLLIFGAVARKILILCSGGFMGVNLVESIEKTFDFCCFTGILERIIQSICNIFATYLSISYSNLKILHVFMDSVI